MSAERVALERVVATHRAVIHGVTPKHPGWCADDEERYNALFSAWHAACYAAADLIGSDPYGKV